MMAWLVGFVTGILTVVLIIALMYGYALIRLHFGNE